MSISDFFGVLGVMTSLYILMELMIILDNKIEESKKLQFLTPILAVISYLFMICSAPIVLLIILHDRRMEKVHRKLFDEDRAPYDNIMQQRIKDLESKVKLFEK